MGNLIRGVSRVTTLLVAAVLAVPPTGDEQPADNAVQGGVDLSFRTDSVATAPGRTGVQRLHIHNGGSSAVTTPVAVAYVTPVYVNVDRTRPLPAGCAMRLRAPEPTVPEVVTCRITPNLPPGAEMTLAIPLAVTTRARFVGRDLGMAMVAPAPGTGSADVNLSDNWNYTFLTVLPPTPKAPEGNRVDLYLTYDVPAMTTTSPSAMTFHYGNKGPQPMRGTTHLTFVTPFYANHAEPLPPGCRMRLTDADPLVPEIVTCTLPPLPARTRTSVAIPVELVIGAPQGTIGGITLVGPAASRGTESDPWQVDNFLPTNIVNITPSHE